MPKSVGAILFSTGHPAPLILGDGQRINVTSGAVATSAEPLSPIVVTANDNTPLVIIRATAWTYVAFGDNSVAATSSNSILVPPGEGVYYLTSTDTHVSVLQVAEAAAVQFEGVR